MKKIIILCLFCIALSPIFATWGFGLTVSGNIAKESFQNLDQKVELVTYTAPISIFANRALDANEKLALCLELGVDVGIKSESTINGVKEIDNLNGKPYGYTASLGLDYCLFEIKQFAFCARASFITHFCPIEDYEGPNTNALFTSLGLSLGTDVSCALNQNLYLGAGCNGNIYFAEHIKRVTPSKTSSYWLTDLRLFDVNPFIYIGFGI